MEYNIEELYEKINNLEKRVRKLELEKELSEISQESIEEKNESAPFGESSSIRISSVPDDDPKPKSNVVKCPKCGSTSIIATNKKLSIKRAVVGAALVNPLGAAVGAVTSKQMYNVCQACGHKWKIK